MKKRIRKKLRTGEFTPAETEIICTSPEGIEIDGIGKIFDRLVSDLEKEGLDCLGKITSSGFRLSVSMAGRRRIDIKRLEIIREITGKYLPDRSVQINMNLI